MNEHIARRLRPDLQVPRCIEVRALSRGMAPHDPEMTDTSVPQDWVAIHSRRGGWSTRRALQAAGLVPPGV